MYAGKTETARDVRAIDIETTRKKTRTYIDKEETDVTIEKGTDDCCSGMNTRQTL